MGGPRQRCCLNGRDRESRPVARVGVTAPPPCRFPKLAASTWWRVWQKARILGLPPAQAATVLLSRPYDLRHSGVTWRLSSGVHPPEVAAWAGHSVEVLMRVYARCMTGLEDVWIIRMDRALHLQDLRNRGQDDGNDPE
jgi:integrase